MASSFGLTLEIKEIVATEKDGPSVNVIKTGSDGPCLLVDGINIHYTDVDVYVCTVRRVVNRARSRTVTLLKPCREFSVLEGNNTEILFHPSGSKQ